MISVLVLGLFVGLEAVPVQKPADHEFQKQDNFLPKFEDFTKFHYSTVGSQDDSLNEIDFKNEPRSLGAVLDFVKDGAEAGMDLLADLKSMFLTENPETTETTTSFYESTTEVTTAFKENPNLDPVFVEKENSTSNRTARQESNEADIDNTNNKDKENQENGSEEEEETPNMITGLVSAFLGGLSRPDGSVDVEAITGLLGSLSVQKDDGSYDFNGLTELLMSFFGGGGEEGGGSNFGAFLGGLAGAFIQGVANPPGAKGAGSFVGNLLGGILPGLSAPAPTEEGDTQQPQKPLDSGGFLGGLLSSVIGNLGGLSNSSGGGGGDSASGGGGNKFSLFKAIFSMITSIFTSSSAGAT